ncbi:MAG: hypothetical protein ACETWB_07645, partial [Anaerolineae bacterium]
AAPPLEAAPVEEALAPAEIPTWLQSLRPPEVSEAVPEEIPAAEAIETKGLLAGIKGILPVEPIISAPHTLKAPLVSAPAAVGPEQAGLFEKIVTKRPLAPVEVEVRRRARILRVDPRWFIYLIVALAVVLPLLSQGQWFDSHDVIVTEAAGEVYEAIQALPEGAMVLVAYDYDPSLAAEMGLQAEAILHHLMDRNLRVMALSLYPSGPEIAQETMDKVAAKHGYLYGKDYVNLGYLAGREAALRGFGLNPLGTAKVDYRDHKSLNTLPVMKDFLPDQGIQNIAMIVELAGGQDALQGWIEQVVSPHKDKVKMVAGVTASIQPFAMPYRDSGQLLGLISGPTGAAEYEVKAGRPSSAVDNLDSQSITLLVVIILMLVGNMEYLVTRLRGGG